MPGIGIRPEMLSLSGGETIRDGDGERCSFVCYTGLPFPLDKTPLYGLFRYRDGGTVKLPLAELRIA